MDELDKPMPDGWLQKQLDHAKANVDSWPAWKRGDPEPTVEQRLSEARATGIREGLEEAARIADRAATHWEPLPGEKEAMTDGTAYAHSLVARVIEQAAKTIRSRAASLPGGETT